MPTKLTDPENWKPVEVEDFIGQAMKWGRMLKGKALRAIGDEGNATPWKYLMYGPPGVGKTALAKAIAKILTSVPHDIEVIAGKEINAARVSKLRHSVGTGSLYGKWIVVIIDEIDTCPKDGQEALLTFLDELPKNRAIFATSNLDISDLTDRFQTRFQHLEFTKPTDLDIAALLDRFDGMEGNEAADIASDADGNVRAALLDAQTHLDYKLFA